MGDFPPDGKRGSGGDHQPHPHALPGLGWTLRLRDPDLAMGYLKGRSNERERWSWVSQHAMEIDCGDVSGD